MTIVVTGSVAFDYIMSFPGRFADHILPDKLDRISLSFLVDDMIRVYGGCGPNIAYSLALLGERPVLLASAGQDGVEYRDWLARNGVDTSHLLICDDCFTASFFVSTDRDQNQIATFYSGAMSRASRLSLRDVPDPEIAIISPNDPEAMHKYAHECRDLGVPYVYDPSQQVARVEGGELLDSLTGAHALIVNEYEYSILQKKTGLDEGALLECVEVLIVTLGDRGSRIVTDGRETHIPVARPHAVLEPTGVGDAYRAGLLVGLVRRFPWPVTGRIAALAAAYVIEHPGPQPQPYTLEAFAERYRENFDRTPELEELLRPR
jgi:adenosine kinase